MRPLSAIGVAGTITSIAALDLGLAEYDPDQVQGHRLSREGVRAQLERLAALPLAERREIPALDPDRAPVIVAGTVILGEVLDHFGLDGLEASEHDILDGAALEAAELPEPKRAKRRPAPTPAASRPSQAVFVDRRRFVLGEPALQDASREDADEPAALDHRHPLGVVLLEEAERLVERSIGVDRVVSAPRPARRSRLRRVEPGGDDLATSVLRVRTPTSAPSASIT